MRSSSRWLATAAAVATLSLCLCLQLPSLTARERSFALRRPPREVEDVLGAVMGSPSVGPLLPLGGVSRIVPKAGTSLPGAHKGTIAPNIKQGTTTAPELLRDVEGAFGNANTGSPTTSDRSPLSKAKAVGIVPDLVAYLPNVTLMVTYPGNLKLAGGTVLASYEGPAPPAGSGSHRLVFAQFQQSYRFARGNFTFIPMREAFNIPAFMADNRIPLIRAFNFFRINTDSKAAL